MHTARTLTTDRLTLRPLALDDATALFAVFQDAETMRYWHELPHRNVGTTRTMIQDMLRPTDNCWWAICLAADAPAIGFVGYLGATALPGMGYILRADCWRQGYATEAVQAAVDYGFRQLTFDRIELWIHEQNRASQALAHKLGFAYRGQFMQKFNHADAAHATLVYGLLAAEWSPALAEVNDPKPASQVSFYAAEPVLPVKDVAATVEFYRTRLGFQVGFLYGDPPTHASVTRGEWSARAVRIQFTQTASKAVDSAAGQIYIFVGAEIDTLYAQYRKQGVSMLKEIASQPWGMREFTIADNNGHQLRFGTPV